MLKKLIAAVVLVIAPFAASATDLPDYPFIHVNGSGRTYAAPDFGEIDFEVSAYNPEPEAARQIVEARIAEVRALLASVGLADADVEIRDIRREIRKGDPSGMVQYDIKAGVHIKVNDLSKWKPLMSPLINMPNVDAFMTVFDSSKREQVEAELTADAIKSARRKAEVIAAGFGRKVGPVNGISVGDLKNVSRSMALAPNDPIRGRTSTRNDSDREGLLMVTVMTLTQSVDVIFRFK